MSGKLSLKIFATYGDVVVMISGYSPIFIKLPDDFDDLKPLFFRERLFAIAGRVRQDVQFHAVFAAVFQVCGDPRFVVRVLINLGPGVRKARPGEIDFAESVGEAFGQNPEGCRIVRFFRQKMSDGEFSPVVFF